MPFKNMPGRFGESSHGRDPEKLAKAFLSMSNDSFFETYGFNWVPPTWLQDKVQKDNIGHNRFIGISHPGGFNV